VKIRPFHPSFLIGGAWVAACLAAVLAGVALTLAPAEQARAWPLPAAVAAPPPIAGPAALATATAAVALLAMAAAHGRAGGMQKPFAALVLLHPLLLAGIWFVLGPGRPSAAALVIGTLLAAAILALARATPRPGPRDAWSRRWLAVDAVMILAPAAIGLAMGTDVALRPFLISLALYPIYALVQLTAFLVVPAGRLRALGLSPAGTAAACASVFALLHWPHPLVMVLTAAGMAAWTLARLQGRPLWHLVLVMGLAATTVTQCLPDQWHGHMRVGPGAVRARAIEALAAAPGGTHADPGPWLDAAFPTVVGRPLAAGERERWLDALARERRIQVAWLMQISGEYARRAAGEDLPPPPPATATWRDLDPARQAYLSAFGEPAVLAAAGGTFDGYVAHLYTAILGRQASAAERAGWRSGLGPIQRRRLAALLLEQRYALARQEFSVDWFPAFALPDG
jgi:hypothetical protein